MNIITRGLGDNQNLITRGFFSISNIIIEVLGECLVFQRSFFKNIFERDQVKNIFERSQITNIFSIIEIVKSLIFKRSKIENIFSSVDLNKNDILIFKRKQIKNIFLATSLKEEHMSEMEWFEKEVWEEIPICGEIPKRYIQTGEKLVLGSCTVDAYDNAGVSTPSILEASTKTIINGSDGEIGTALRIRIKGGIITKSPYRIVFSLVTDKGAKHRVNVKAKIIVPS